MPEDTDTTDVLDVTEQEEENFSGGFEDDTGGLAGAGSEGGEAGAKADKDDKGAEAGEDGKVDSKVDEEGAEGAEKGAKAKPTPEPTLEEKAEHRVAQEQFEQAETTFWGQIQAKAPDIKEIAGSEDFTKWLGQQSDRVYAMANQNQSVEDALAVFEMFDKRDKSAPAGGSDDQGAQAVPTTLDKEFWEALKVMDGEEEKDFTALVDEYGELGVMVKTGLEAIYAKLAGQAGGGGSADLAQKLGQLDSRIGEMSYWNEVQTEHPDARTILAAPEYKDWISKQNPMVQRFATSTQAEDVVAVLDEYKKQAVTKASGTAKERQDKSRRKLGGILKTGPQGGSAGADGGSGDEESFSGGFEEDDEK